MYAGTLLYCDEEGCKNVGAFLENKNSAGARAFIFIRAECFPTFFVGFPFCFQHVLIAFFPHNFFCECEANTFNNSQQLG